MELTREEQYLLADHIDAYLDGHGFDGTGEDEDALCSLLIHIKTGLLP